MNAGKTMKAVIGYVLAFALSLWNALRDTTAHLGQPRTLVLTVDQAEYVSALFLGDTPPEVIGRSVDRMFDRKRWKYFRVFDFEKHAFKFADQVDYWLDGLEYIRAASITLGAMTPKKDGDYYEASHPMTQKLAGQFAKADFTKKEN